MQSVRSIITNAIVSHRAVSLCHSCHVFIINIVLHSIVTVKNFDITYYIMIIIIDCVLGFNIAI